MSSKTVLDHLDDLSFNVNAGSYDTEEYPRMMMVRWMEKYDQNGRFFDKFVTDKIDDFSTTVKHIWQSISTEWNLDHIDSDLACIYEPQLGFMMIEYIKPNIVLTVRGPEEFIKQCSKFKSKSSFGNHVTLWFTDTTGTTQSKKIPFTIDNYAIDEMYPYFDKPIDDYYKGYMDSPSPILLLLGEPGTGKTTFLRTFLSRHNLDCTLTYCETTMKSDNFYFNFLMSDSSDILIIEDADTILKSRENFGNHIMTKLLNFSEGLVPISSKKKIVFTTNLESERDVDPALVRPGRCYDILKFRPLKGEEVGKLQRKIGHEVTPVTGEKTVAEIFSSRGNPSKKGVGFLR